MSKNDNSNIMAEMFFRNRLVLSNNVFEQVSSTRVAVVGIGGVGSVVCEQLIRLGLQNIIFFARGSYELGNINRQIPATYLSVKSKTKKINAMAERLNEINPFANIDPVECDVVKNNDLLVAQLQEYKPSVIFNCVDENYAQALIANNALNLNIPCFIGGVTGLGYEGIVSMFPTTGVEYKDVFPYDFHSINVEDASSEDIRIKQNWKEKYSVIMPTDTKEKYDQNIRTPYPVLTPVPWIVSSILVLEFIKFILHEEITIIAPKALYIQPMINKFEFIDLTGNLNVFPWRP